MLAIAVSAGRSFCSQPAQYDASIATQITRLLLRNGARIGSCDKLGYTPLHLAAYFSLPGALAARVTPSVAGWAG